MIRWDALRVFFVFGKGVGEGLPFTASPSQPSRNEPCSSVSFLLFAWWDEVCDCHRVKGHGWYFS